MPEAISSQQQLEKEKQRVHQALSIVGRTRQCNNIILIVNKDAPLQKKLIPSSLLDSQELTQYSNHVNVFFTTTLRETGATRILSSGIVGVFLNMKFQTVAI